MMKEDKNDGGTSLTGVDAVSVSVPASTASHAAPTPTPWKAIQSFGDEREIVGQRGDVLAVVYCSDGADDPVFYPAPANAELIVRCVNSHAALVEALKALRNESRAVLALSYDEIKDSAGYTNLKCFLNRIEEAEAALTHAEVKP